MVRWTKTLTLCTVVGCSGYDVTSVRGGASAGPIIRTDPVALDFGGLPLGQSATRGLRIVNDGDEDLRITRLLLGPTQAFSVDEAEGAWLVPPQSVWVAQVTYTPLSATDQSWLTIISNDPRVSSLDVTLSGKANLPELSISPDPLDFGSVPKDCTEVESVDLINTGQAPVIVDAIQIVGSYALESAPNLPLTLLPSQSVPIDVGLTPDQVGVTYLGQIHVLSDDPRGLTRSALQGVGGSGAEHVETFDQVVNDWTRIDIAFWVDQSGSMGNDQDNLADNFDTFLDILQVGAVDYSLIAVTADSGCFNNAVIGPHTADAEVLFDKAVHGPGGTYNSGSREAGLWGARALIEAAQPGGCNSAWLRPDAQTVVVVLSDELDQSPGRWQDYVSDMRRVVPDVVVTSVVGQPGSTCAWEAPRYWDATIETGGANLEICQPDWGGYFYEILGVHDPPHDSFALAHVPDPDTIEVEIDGLPVSKGWIFDESTNAVVFQHTALPPPASQIRITYQEVSGCS